MTDWVWVGSHLYDGLDVHVEVMLLQSIAASYVQQIVISVLQQQVLLDLVLLQTLKI